MTDQFDPEDIRMADEVLAHANGDARYALILACEFARYCYRWKGKGIDREGGPRNPNWPVRYSSPPILTTEGK